MVSFSGSALNVEEDQTLCHRPSPSSFTSSSTIIPSVHHSMTSSTTRCIKLPALCECFFLIHQETMFLPLVHVFLGWRKKQAGRVLFFVVFFPFFSVIFCASWFEKTGQHRCGILWMHTCESCKEFSFFRCAAVTSKVMLNVLLVLSLQTFTKFTANL